MANSRDGSASRGGRGHQNQSEAAGVERAAPAALAFLLGLLMHLMQEPGSQVRQPQVSWPLPNEEIPGAALDAAGSASPSHLPAPSQHRLAGEALGEEKDTSEACDKLVDHTAKRRTQPGGTENASQGGSGASVARLAKRTAGTLGAEALPDEPPDSSQTGFLSLLSSFGSAGAGVEQTKNPLIPKGVQFAQPARRRTAVPQSKSAPSGSSQTPTPLNPREKNVRRVFSEPGRSTESSSEALTDKPVPRTSMLPTRISRSSVNTQKSDGASRVGTRSRPRWAAGAHEEDDTSDASDTSGESTHKRTKGTRGAEALVHEHSHMLQPELLNLLHKLYDASLDSQSSACGCQHQSTTATPTTRRKDQQQQAKRAFPRSVSAPSPGLQSRSHNYFDSTAHQQEAPEPSPPRSPRSDESLDSYLEEAYHKWRRYRLARVHSDESEQVRPRVVQRTPGRPSQDGRPVKSQHHPNRRSWPGRASEKSPPYLRSASDTSQHCRDVQCNHSKPHSSRSSALDGVPSDDTSASSGENWHADASPAKTGGHQVFPAPKSAPSPYRSISVFADGNWREHGRQAASHHQRVEQPVQKVWNQPAGLGTKAVTGRRASVPRTQSCRHSDSFQDTGVYTQTLDLSSSSAAPLWAEPRGTDGIPRGNIIHAPHSSGPMPIQPTGLPPWNMTVQFYNHPSLHPEGHADLPPRPPLSGHARGTQKQVGKKRFISNREDRRPTPKATETWQGHPQGGKTTMPYAYPQKTPQLPPEEERSAPRIEGPSTLHTAPSDFTDEPEKRGVPSLVPLSVMEVGPHAPTHPLGIPSASAAALAGARLSMRPSLRKSRIPVLRRRFSTPETQASASLSLSLPRTLRSEIGDPSAAAASPLINASQAPFLGYSHLQTLDLRAPFAAAAANQPSQPYMSGERFHTGQSSQGLLLSSPSGHEHRRAASSTSNWAQSHSSPGRTVQTASTARPGSPEENSYESASDEPRRRSHSTGAIRTIRGRAAAERRAGQPVEDEFLD